MMLLGFLITLIGFVVLSLAMKRHYQQLRGKCSVLNDKQVVALRTFGFASLASASVLCMVGSGIALGLVYWAGFITVSVLAQTLLLSYRPQWLAGSVLTVLLMSAVLEGMNYAIY